MKTELFRAINPAFVQNGHVAIQAFQVSPLAFRPTEQDKGKLSVYSDAVFTAKEATEHRRAIIIGSGTQRQFPVGVLSVTVQECQDLSLTTVQDNDPFVGHAHIDFTAHEDPDNSKITKSRYLQLATQLRDYAEARGWRYKV